MTEDNIESRIDRLEALVENILQVIQANQSEFREYRLQQQQSHAAQTDQPEQQQFSLTQTQLRRIIDNVKQMMVVWAETAAEDRKLVIEMQNESRRIRGDLLNWE
jgi:DNA polymerase III sliding clamp (beta) subunit (PCNA family)